MTTDDPISTAMNDEPLASESMPQQADGASVDSARTLAVPSDTSVTLLSESKGSVDGIANYAVCGWAWDPARPSGIAELELLIDGRVASRFLARRYRHDLLQAGIGTGEHGFDIGLPLTRSMDCRISS